MSDEVVVDRMRSYYGMHMVHVMRSGCAVDLERWINGIPEGERESVMWLAYNEPELGMWHLQLYWKEKGAAGYGRWSGGENWQGLVLHNGHYVPARAGAGDPQRERGAGAVAVPAGDRS